MYLNKNVFCHPNATLDLVEVCMTKKKITTYLAGIRGQLHSFCHSVTCEGSGIGARVNLLLEAADNISRTHVSL